MKVVVYHSTYGCDTGCCGHVVQITTDEGKFEKSKFEFTHPYGKDRREFVKNLVTETFGAEHVADIDWDNVIVSEE